MYWHECWALLMGVVCGWGCDGLVVGGYGVVVCESDDTSHRCDAL